MPNRAIEIHDSTLDHFIVHDGLLELHFSSAYIHYSEGRPGIDAGKGWTQEARLLVKDRVIRSSFSSLPRDLEDGFIKTDEEVSDDLIPIPLNYNGSVEVRLESSGEILSVVGTQATLELFGEPSYVEEFRPHS
ncbi:MAG TPA: hypothetical protein VJN89_05340 [Candidatus Acidoferrum sp.]|nr:hypothetical protein [Candidatus Acidoferrum sp.]